MSDSSSGIGALVKLTSWLECRLDCELLSIGRSAEDSEESCTAIICGKHLIYAIVWDTNTVALLAQTLDSIELPEVLLSMDNNLDGWKTISSLLRALEHNEVKSLQRPIEIGGTGPESWVIDV